ncbi:MAG TPA: hypothetical protein VJ860_09150 [Polyangia bacterium]|nr:hypothetical protein [Polyangia bacterium]
MTNAGALPLEIGTIEASRFCSAGIDPKTIAPGASGQLEVTCRSDLQGPLREFLLVHSNDPLSDRVPIELVAKVTPLLGFDTQVVTLEMPFGEERSQEVHLVGTWLDRAAIRLKASAVAEDSSVDRLSAPTGATRGFRIRCKGKKAGVHSGNLVVSTGLPEPKEIAMPYVCKVPGTLEISPTNPYFNLKIQGPKVVSIEVRSSQPGFEVRGARVLDGPFAASVEGPLPDKSFRVQVKVLEDRVKKETRGSLGKVMVLSNDRTEPEKEIPLFGFGKLNAAKAEETPPAP